MWPPVKMSFTPPLEPQKKKKYPEWTKHSKSRWRHLWVLCQYLGGNPILQVLKTTVLILEMRSLLDQTCGSRNNSKPTNSFYLPQISTIRPKRLINDWLYEIKVLPGEAWISFPVSLRCKYLIFCKNSYLGHLLHCKFHGGGGNFY